MTALLTATPFTLAYNFLFWKNKKVLSELLLCHKQQFCRNRIKANSYVQVTLCTLCNALSVLGCTQLDRYPDLLQQQSLNQWLNNTYPHRTAKTKQRLSVILISSPVMWLTYHDVSAHVFIISWRKYCAVCINKNRTDLWVAKHVRSHFWNLNWFGANWT